MNCEKRREMLQEIFEKVGTRRFASFARKNGLDVPYPDELSSSYTLGLWLSDNIEEGYLYDSKDDNDWISEWYKYVHSPNF